MRFHEESEKTLPLKTLAGMVLKNRRWRRRSSSIFEYFKELTLKDAKKVYDRLGIEFDSYAGESFTTIKCSP